MAALLSGAPSTIHALATNRDPFEATLAAGSILRPNEHRRIPLLLAAVPVHLGVSGFWALVLTTILPRRRRGIEAMLAALAIGAIDLLVIGRRFPRIRALPKGPQFADHIAFTLILMTLLPDRKGS